MPPRHQTLPAAQTTSAKEAQKSFYCTLCSKGYARMNDYEAHLSSYDHSHKQRLRDMKVMTRDPNASSRARKAEAKADGLVSIKIENASPGTGSGAGGFKKGGFKKSGFKSAFIPATSATVPESAATGTKQPNEPKVASATISAPSKPALTISNMEESDSESESYEPYDPRYPTD